ncbi:MAG TPA: PH domain-containing protein [Rugosimonospora sp.]|nr:PH domain-containing protein [Rugosimonospora sp.]
MTTDDPRTPPDPDRPGRAPESDQGSGPRPHRGRPAYDDDTAEFPPQIDEEEIAGLRYGGTPVGPRSVMPLEDEPSGLVSRYLFPTEKFRGEWKKHWIHLVKEFLIGAAATVLMGWLTGFLGKHNQNGLVTVAVLAWIGVLGFVGWRMLDWWYDRFILTNKRIMVVKGLITRSVGMMPLVRVTDMKYEQSPLGRMLNYGTFVVESAGQDQALRTVKPLPNPNELYLRIVEEMYEPEAVEARLSRSAEESTTGDA